MYVHQLKLMDAATEKYGNKQNAAQFHNVVIGSYEEKGGALFKI